MPVFPVSHSLVQNLRRFSNILCNHACDCMIAAFMNSGNNQCSALKNYSSTVSFLRPCHIFLLYSHLSNNSSNFSYIIKLFIFFWFTSSWNLVKPTQSWNPTFPGWHKLKKLRKPFFEPWKPPFPAGHSMSGKAFSKHQWISDLCPWVCGEIWSWTSANMWWGKERPPWIHLKLSSETSIDSPIIIFSTQSQNF